MAEQLGAYLVRKGLITQTQLDEAVKSQLIYGGSLGTNLVEMGLLDLPTLGQALSDTLHVPLAVDAEAEAVPAETLALLKPELARAHLAFPLALEGRRLRVAMADPQDPKHVDALAFATGMRIVPSVLPELRLHQLLEKRYGLPRPLRPHRPGQPKPAAAPAASVITGSRPPIAPPPSPSTPLGVKPPGLGAPAFAPAPVASAKPPAPLLGSPSSPGVAAPLKPSGPPGPPLPSAGAPLPPRPSISPGVLGSVPPGAPPPRPATVAPPGPPLAARPLGAPPSAQTLPPGMVQRSMPGASAPGLAGVLPGTGPGSPPGVAGPRVALAGSAVAAPGPVPPRPAAPGPVAPGAQVSVGTLAVARPPGSAPSPGVPAPSSVARPPPPGSGSAAPSPLAAPLGTRMTPAGAAAAPLAPAGGSLPPVALPGAKVTSPGLAVAPSSPANEALKGVFATLGVPASGSSPAAPRAVTAPPVPVAQGPARVPEKPVPAAPPAPVRASVPSPPAPTLAAAPTTGPSAGAPPISLSVPVTLDFPGMEDWGAQTPAPVPFETAPASEAPAPMASAPVAPPVVEAHEVAAPDKEPVKAEPEKPEPVKPEPVKAEPITVAPVKPAAPAEAAPPSSPEPSASARAAASPAATSEGGSVWKPRSLSIEPVELPLEPSGEMEVSSQFDPSELGSATTSSWGRRAIEVDFSSQEEGAPGLDTAEEREGVPLASVLDFVPSWDPSVESARDEAGAQDAADREDSQRVPLQEAVEELQRATSRGELGKALLSYVRGRFPRGFLLGETFGSARVGRAYGEGSDRPEVAALQVDLDAPSLLAMAAQQGGPVVSSMPESQTDEVLFAALGESFSHLMAVPLRMRERAVGFMVVDGGPSPFGDEELEEMGRLLTAASEACGRLHELP